MTTQTPAPDWDARARETIALCDHDWSDAERHIAAALRSAHASGLSERDAGPVWRHKKRGTTYAIVGNAEVQSSGLEEGEVTVVYRSREYGDLHVRRKSEFHDGRFEQIAEPKPVSERDAGWQPIEGAPRDGTVVDVWLIGSLSDIEFYCSSPPQKVGRGKYCGRSAGWMWLVDKWRPFLSGLNMPTFIQPTHWRPLPSPPDPKDDQQS